MPQVKALQDHTCNGVAYHAGDTYDAPDELIATLQIQGKAIPVGAGETEPILPGLEESSQE